MSSLQTWTSQLSAGEAGGVVGLEGTFSFLQCLLEMLIDAQTARSVRVAGHGNAVEAEPRVRGGVPQRLQPRIHILRGPPVLRRLLRLKELRRPAVRVGSVIISWIASAAALATTTGL